MLKVAGLLALLAFTLPVAVAQVAAITSDPPQDKNAPAAMQSFQIPSHGSLLNALVYEAAGAGPHATVVLLHGFPGNEKNLDLAQAIRRAGWNVLYFDYRGSWGTPGDFSFTHCMEDTQAALAYLREPANAKKLRVDPAKLVLMGHSMGGMITAYVGAHDEHLLGTGLISAADMAGFAKLPPGATAETRQQTLARVAKALEAEGMAPLAGCTPLSLAQNLMDHPEYQLSQDIAGLKAKPILIVTSDDGLAESAKQLGDALLAGGNEEVKYVHFAIDHSYSDKRIALEETVLGGLDYLSSR